MASELSYVCVWVCAGLPGEPLGIVTTKFRWMVLGGVRVTCLGPKMSVFRHFLATFDSYFRCRAYGKGHRPFQLHLGARFHCTVLMVGQDSVSTKSMLLMKFIVTEVFGSDGSVGTGHFVHYSRKSVTLSFFKAKFQFGDCQNLRYSRKSIISESVTSENLCIMRLFNWGPPLQRHWWSYCTFET